MEYTTNYHLPQWKKEDRIMMEDFNQMCQNIEQGISSTAHALDVKIGTAQATANTARSEAAEAAKLPYVVGSYTGDEQEERTFNLGFRPRFVIICRTQSRNTISNAGSDVLVGGPTVDSDRLYMTDTGFRLTLGPDYRRFPPMNDTGVQYDYIAFR